MEYCGLTAEQQDDWQEVVSMLAAESRLQVFGLCEVGCELPEFVGFTRFQAAHDPSRATRRAGRGQGLCVYVWDRWVQCASLVKTTRHYVWLCLQLPGCKPLFLAALCVPPASSTAAWSLGSWQDMMTELQADVVAFKAESLGKGRLHSWVM